MPNLAGNTTRGVLKPQGKRKPWLAITLIVISAVLFGLAAASAEPVIISMALATLLGIGLLFRPVWMIWLVLVLGLLVVGLVPIWAEGLATKAVWGVSLLGLLLLVFTLARTASVSATTHKTPAFVWLSFAFVLFVLINGLLNWHDPYQYFSGMKRYFQAIGILFAFAWLPIREEQIGRIRTFFIVVALAQVPWAIYELAVLVPIREGFVAAYPGLVPVDAVAGTFGVGMYTGGSNAEMATFLLLTLGFLLSRRRMGIGRRTSFILLLVPILLPIFMGETKIVVIFLPLLFLTLYRSELLARPHYAIGALLAGGVLTLAAGYAYLNAKGLPLDEFIDNTIQYNLLGKRHGAYLLNRTTALSFWYDQHGAADPVETVLGHGLGSAHDRSGGHVSLRYPGFGIGLTAASSLLWEQGILGTLLFFSVLVAAWRTANSVQRTATIGWIKADACAIQSALPILFLYVFYRLSPLEELSFQIVIFTLLGYLAWLARSHSVSAQEQTRYHSLQIPRILDASRPNAHD